MIQLQDFDYWAQKVLSQVAWAYYRSAADQERCTVSRISYQNPFSNLNLYNTSRYS